MPQTPKCFISLRVLTQFFLFLQNAFHLPHLSFTLLFDLLVRTNYEDFLVLCLGLCLKMIKETKVGTRYVLSSFDFFYM